MSSGEANRSAGWIGRIASFGLSSIFAMKNGLYVGQPHRKRLQDLHDLSKQLLETSRMMARSQRFIPDSSATLTRLQEIKSQTPIPTTLVCSNSVDTATIDDPEPAVRRYTDPVKPISIIRRKDSPEYFLTISSAAYQEYASKPESKATSVTPSRPRSENRRRRTMDRTASGLRTTKAISRSYLFYTSKSPISKRPHYMRPIASAKPLSPRKYLLKRTTHDPLPRTCVFDLQDVLDARQGTIVPV